jgi:D-threo-aldose 1-dehydrogenase
MERVAALERVCDAHAVPLAAAALQFPLAHPQVVSVIAGLKTPTEVEQAKAMIAWRIPASLWSDLQDEGLVRRDAPPPENAVVA